MKMPLKILNNDKATMTDVREFDPDLTLQAQYKSERSEELQWIANLRKQQLTSALRTQGFPPNIHNHEQLRSAISRLHGAQTLGLLDEKLTFFMQTKGMLTPRHIKIIRRLLNSSEVAHFQKAITMVTLNPSSPVNSQAQRAVAIELAKLPINLLNRADIAGLTVRVTHDNVTTYNNDLAGTGVRGYDDGNWSKLQGVGAFGKSKETIIAMEQDRSGKWRVGTKHGSANLVIHEFGHSIDRLLGANSTGINLSKNNTFYTAWYNDFHKLDPYFQQAGAKGDYEPGLEESFAEGLARLYGNNKTFTHWTNIENELLNL